MTICPFSVKDDEPHDWDGRGMCRTCLERATPVDDLAPRTARAIAEGQEKALKSPQIYDKPKKRSKPRKKPEQQLQRDILKFLRANNIFCWKVETTGMPIRNRAGQVTGLRPSLIAGHPDLAGVLPDGRALFVEVKTKTGTVSALQKKWLDRLTEQGALAVVARSVEEVREALDREGYLVQ